MSLLSAEIRKLRGLHSQEEFAKSVGVTRQIVASWESGSSLPSFRSARRLVEKGLDFDLVLGAHKARDDQRLAGVGR